jgi:hypothetical protein
VTVRVDIPIDVGRDEARPGFVVGADALPGPSVRSVSLSSELGNGVVAAGDQR